MANIYTSENSFWAREESNQTYGSLQNDIEVDVAIVGGGITGLTCAYILKKTGMSVAVLEKNRIASGTTAGTTGKVTSQHGIMYADLYNRQGIKAARAYADANQAAIEQIQQIIKKEKIECNWNRADNYIYTTDKRKLKEFKTEAAIAKKIGLPASFETDTELPFSVVCAVKFKNQAYFNAHKYVHGLAKAVHGQGSYVFERSNVKIINDGLPASIGTDSGKVKSKYIIIASKVPAWPLWARLSYSFSEYPHTSYISAGQYDGNVSGMYISPDSDNYSILPVKDHPKKILLIGGENHIPGLGLPKRRLDKLAKYSKQNFSVKPAFQWKAMDYIAYDEMPLVGKVYPWSKRLYTVTGLKKWGLTTSMVAANILRDNLLNRPNNLIDLFDSTRLKPVLSIPRLGFKWFEKLPNAAKAFGLILILAGIAGFVPLLTVTGRNGYPLLLGFLVGIIHNLIHLSSGVVALISSKKALWARTYFQVFGILYGLVAIIGFMHGYHIFGLFPVNLADNFLHLAISATSLWLGFIGGKT